MSGKNIQCLDVLYPDKNSEKYTVFICFCHDKKLGLKKTVFICFYHDIFF